MQALGTISVGRDAAGVRGQLAQRSELLQGSLRSRGCTVHPKPCASAEDISAATVTIFYTRDSHY